MEALNEDVTTSKLSIEETLILDVLILEPAIMRALSLRYLDH